MLFFLLLWGVTPAIASQSYDHFQISNAESERILSDQYRHCMDASRGVTSNLRDCSYAESQRIDTHLNAAYRAAMARLGSTGARTRLRALERRWVATRYQNCERDARSERGGTLWLIIMDACGLDEDVRRIAWLERYGRRL